MVGGGRGAVSVCAGFGHSVAVGADGAVYVWGKGMSDSVKRDTDKYG